MYLRTAVIHIHLSLHYCFTPFRNPPPLLYYRICFNYWSRRVWTERESILTCFFKVKLFCSDMRKAVQPNFSLSCSRFFHQVSSRACMWSCSGASDTGSNTRTSEGRKWAKSIRSTPKSSEKYMFLSCMSVQQRGHLKYSGCHGGKRIKRNFYLLNIIIVIQFKFFFLKSPSINFLYSRSFPQGRSVKLIVKLVFVSLIIFLNSYHNLYIPAGVS